MPEKADFGEQKRAKMVHGHNNDSGSGAKWAFPAQIIWRYLREYEKNALKMLLCCPSESLC
jgi:hypothetical protein